MLNELINYPAFSFIQLIYCILFVYHMVTTLDLLVGKI